LLAKLIYKTDLNLQNINGETPLHLLCKYHNWKNYNLILIQKDLDIFLKDNNNYRPIDYLNDNSLFNFIDIVLKSYTKFINYNNNDILSKKDCRNNIKSTECSTLIKKYIFDTKRSIPAKYDYSMISNKINMIDENFTNYGIFNSDSLHNMIYTIILMKKY